MEQKETTQEVSATEEEKNKNVVTNPSSSSSNWWSGWVSQAKEKSASVLQAVKNDLDEITTAVTETFHIAPSEFEESEQEVQAEIPSDQQQQSSTVNYMKQSLSTFFGSVSAFALVPQLDEEDASEAVLITSDDTIVLTGFSKHLADLQNNDETYLEEPTKSEELAEKYRMWLEIVEQDQFTQQRVNKLLESSQILNEKYNHFVPDTVSHMNFFKRYLFKKALLEDELANEERRKKEVVIEKQPESVTASKPKPEPVIESLPALKPDITDLDVANFELSEEEQARLLNEYEQEIKEREKVKTEIPEVLPVASKTAMKSARTASKSNSNVQSKGKNNKNVKVAQQQPPQKSTQQQNPVKGGKKPTAELKMEKDHFKKESESSTSDESWEKEFDL